MENDIFLVKEENAPKMEYFNKPSVLQVSILFSVAVMLFLFVGVRFQHRNFHTGVLLVEFVLVLMPSILFLLLCKYDIKKVLRLHKISLINTLLVVSIMIFSIPLVGIFNALNLLIIKLFFGSLAPEHLPSIQDWRGVIVNILIMACSAAICEEVLFRGAILRGFERLGIVKAIILTAVLFGFMHMDMQKIFGTILLGALIGYMVYRTNSIFAGMIAHFTNNAAAVFTLYLSNFVTANGKRDLPKFDPKILASGGYDFIIVVVLVIIGAGILFCLSSWIGLIQGFIKNTEKTVVKVQRQCSEIKLKGALWLIPGLASVVFIYYSQGLGLIGIKNETVKMILKMISSDM